LSWRTYSLFAIAFYLQKIIGLP
jgi:hypothetical protein